MLFVNVANTCDTYWCTACVTVHTSRFIIMLTARLLGCQVSSNISSLNSNYIWLPSWHVLEKPMIMHTKFANVKVTVDAAILRNEPVPLTDIANSKIWLGPDFILYAVDVKIRREVFHSTSRNTNICTTLRTSEQSSGWRWCLNILQQAAETHRVMTWQYSRVFVFVNTYRTL